MKSSLLAREIRAICLLSLGVASIAHAEPDSAVLDEVIVEGDRINVIPTEKLESVFGFGKTAVETPRSITTISKEMLDKVLITEIDDLVALTPGSFTQSFFGVAGSLDVRGTPGENYFRGVKRIDNPGNYPTPIGASDRIDVVRGPASPIYGPSKIGGYLNFVPKSARASTGQLMNQATGEIGVTMGSWDKKVISAEVGGPGELFNKPLGYYLYTEFENSDSYYDNTTTDQSLYQASFDLALTDTSRLEFGGMYQDYKGNQVAGWNRLTQELIDDGTYITGSPPSLDTDGDGLLSADESNAGAGLAAFLFGPQTPQSILAALQANPNLNLENPGTAHIDGNTVLVQEDDTLESEVLTLYFDYIYESGNGLMVTNKTFFESLDNVNENAYGFSQMADTWVVEDQLVIGYEFSPTDVVEASVQVSPSIRHQDFEHGDNFDNEYFDRRDITLPGSPIDRRTMATRGQENYSQHTVGDFTNYALAAMADVTFFGKLNLLAGARYDYLDMKSEILADSNDSPGTQADDTDSATSWSASLSYQLPWGLRPYVTRAEQSTLILGQGGQIPALALADGNAVADSELTEYGIKAAMLENKLYLALDYFEQERLDYNAQDTVTNNTTRAEGYEFEARWVVTNNVTLTGAYTNLKVYNMGALDAGSQFSFVGAADLQGVDPSLLYGGVGLHVVGVDGKEDARKAGIPETMFSVYAMFSFDGMLSGLTGSIGGSHVDSVYSGFAKNIKLPSYTLLNASVYYETSSWKVGLQGKNLTDERYFRSNFPDLFGNSVVLPELPRSYLVSAAYKF
ncbi:iron complex outermembrane receptor protein [Povalibacter uvarum]|uniref:Iron complex outermembrane receptor protein n=1 Tax=Povalibacter uvarum TaxID=732238 RepID=A0A841HTB1_9GAMM|nr:TonB-dependent receptor [Povalibacter uvarum]MBB6095539.1 iron complex outermembrane receptor protein [Povalibacter uvarum]